MHAMADTPEYLTIEQAAQLLGVSARTLRLYIAQGKLTGYKPRVGRSAQLVRRSEVETLREIVPVDRSDQADD